MRARYWLLLVANVVVAASPQSRAQGLTLQQMTDQTLDRLINRYEEAKETPDEPIAYRQISAALSNIAHASPRNVRALAMLRQLSGTGDFQTSTVRWSTTGDDGTPITCIVSPKTTQIIWRGKYAEMNPSENRWARNCRYSSPAVKQALERAVMRTRGRVEATLRDPDGTRYRNMTLMASDNGIAICGEINARNGFGGFTGYNAFIASPTFAYFADDDLRGAGVIGNWKDMCSGTGEYHKVRSIEWK